MKSVLYYSKRIRIFILPVLSLISIALYAQNNTSKIVLPLPSEHIENLPTKLSDNILHEIAAFSQSLFQETINKGNNSFKRDSVYTYAFVSGNDSALHNKRIYYYNIDGQIVRNQLSLWNKKVQLWLDEKKTEYTYDDYGNISSVSDYQYINEIWLPGSRKEYEYDSTGNLLMNAYYSLDFLTGEWIGLIKTIFTYYPGGLRKSYSNYEWDSDDSKWIKRTRSENTYNDNALLETRIFSMGDESGSNWIHYRKQEFRYNDAGQYLSGQTYYYSTENEEWTLSSRDSAFYDTLNHVTETVIYTLNSARAEWVYSFKNVRTCLSAAENHCVTISYGWDAEENDWVLTSDSFKDVRNKVLFASGGFWRSRFTFNWDSISARWKPSLGYTQSYDSAGHRTSFTPYSPAIINDEIMAIPDFHDTAFYNQEGLLIWKAFYRSWDTDLSEWKTGEKTKYYYNENLQLTYSSFWEMAYPDDWVLDSSSEYFYSDFELPENKIYSSNDTLFAVPENAGFYQWFDCQSGEEIKDANKNWFYSGISGTYGVRIIKDNYILSPSCYDLAVAIKNPENRLFRCYPNPSKGNLYLEFYQTDFSELEGTITNLAGVQVKTFLIPGNSSLISLDLSGLSSGIYILRIRKGNQIIQIQKISVVNDY